MEKESNSEIKGNSNVSVQEKTEQIKPEKKAQFDVEYLIQTCGQVEMSDRINKLDKIFSEYEFLKEDGDIISMLKDTIDAVSNKKSRGVTTNEEKEKLKITMAELIEIKDTFFDKKF